jgi:hypothetical protein
MPKQSKSGFNENYQVWLCNLVQSKTPLRMQKFTQQAVAELTGTSLRTVQHFECYRSENAKLIYFYSNLA